MKKILFTIVAFLGILSASQSQTYIRTNLAMDAVIIPNLGFETSITNKLTIGADFHYSWVNKGRHKTNGWFSSAELRYYFNERFRGHHFGLTASYYKLNDLKFIYSENYVHDGSAIGVGLLYGYSINLSDKWNLSINIGCEFANINGEHMYKSHNVYIFPSEKTSEKYILPRGGVVIGYKLGSKHEICARYRLENMITY